MVDVKSFLGNVFPQISIPTYQNSSSMLAIEHPNLHKLHATMGLRNTKRACYVPNVSVKSQHYHSFISIVLIEKLYQYT